MSSHHSRKAKYGSPEWGSLVRAIAARVDIQQAFADPFEDGATTRQRILIGRVAEELGFELESLEHMKLHGALLDIFFPRGLPRSGAP